MGVICVGVLVMMICLPPQGTLPHTQQPTWPTAHSQHCGHTALPPGQKTNPRRRADPTQTVYVHPFWRAQTCEGVLVGCVKLRFSLYKMVFHFTALL